MTRICPKHPTRVLSDEQEACSICTLYNKPQPFKNHRDLLTEAACYLREFYSATNPGQTKICLNEAHTRLAAIIRWRKAAMNKTDVTKVDKLLARGVERFRGHAKCHSYYIKACHILAELI